MPWTAMVTMSRKTYSNLVYFHQWKRFKRKKMLKLQRQLGTVYVAK